MTQVVDYSAGFPTAAAIKAAGKVGAVRYIGFPARRKCTTRAELTDFTAHQLGMAVIFEDSDTSWTRGFAGGQQDAVTARTHASAIGFPLNRPIYFAVDKQVTGAASHNLAVDYIRGAASVLGPTLTGVYGQYSVMVAVAAANACRYYWQCRAWSGTPIQFFGGRHLFQNVGTVVIGGIGCDTNDVAQADWGQHDYEGGWTLTPDQEADLIYKVGMIFDALYDTAKAPHQITLIDAAYESYKQLASSELAAGGATVPDRLITVEQLVRALGDDENNIISEIRQPHQTEVTVNPTVISDALTAAIGNMSDSALVRFAQACADESDRRERARLGNG